MRKANRLISSGWQRFMLTILVMSSPVKVFAFLFASCGITSLCHFNEGRAGRSDKYARIMWRIVELELWQLCLQSLASTRGEESEIAARKIIWRNPRKHSLLTMGRVFVRKQFRSTVFVRVHVSMERLEFARQREAIKRFTTLCRPRSFVLDVNEALNFTPQILTR